MAMRMTVPDRQATQKPRTKRNIFFLSGRFIDARDVTAAGIQHPECTIRHARRMRHRQLVGNDPIGLNIDDDAALFPLFTPSIEHVALTDGGHVFRRACDHGHSIQMTAILRSELRDKLWLPDRPEAVDLVNGRKQEYFVLTKMMRPCLSTASS